MIHLVRFPGPDQPYVTFCGISDRQWLEPEFKHHMFTMSWESYTHFFRPHPQCQACYVAHALSVNPG